MQHVALAYVVLVLLKGNDCSYQLLVTTPPYNRVIKWIVQNGMSPVFNIFDFACVLSMKTVPPLVTR